jgi:hypothetical protein
MPVPQTLQAPRPVRYVMLVDQSAIAMSDSYRLSYGRKSVVVKSSQEICCNSVRKLVRITRLSRKHTGTIRWQFMQFTSMLQAMPEGFPAENEWN